MGVGQTPSQGVVKYLLVSHRYFIVEHVASCMYLLTSRYELREYWYMELMAAISERTKNRTAPLLAAGRYPSLTSSISFEVTSANFNFSNTCII